MTRLAAASTVSGHYSQNIRKNVDATASRVMEHG